MLLLSALTGIMICLVLLILIDDKTSIKVPFLHDSRTHISVLIKTAYRSDFVVNTIKYLKKIRSNIISNNCRLAK